MKFTTIKNTEYTRVESREFATYLVCNYGGMKVQYKGNWYYRAIDNGYGDKEAFYSHLLQEAKKNYK